MSNHNADLCQFSQNIAWNPPENKYPGRFMPSRFRLAHICQQEKPVFTSHLKEMGLFLFSHKKQTRQKNTFPPVFQRSKIHRKPAAVRSTVF